MGFVHRRHEVVAVHDEAVRVQRFVVAARACGHKDGLDIGVAGKAHLVLLLAVAVAFEFKEGHVKRRRLHIAHPARHGDTVVGHGGIERRVFASRAAKRALVHPRDVRRVKQVVGNVQVVASHVDGFALVAAPGRVVPMGNLVDGGRVGALRLTHPDPQQAVTLMQGVSTHTRTGRRAVHARHLDAGTAAVKGQAVVAAFQVVALDAPQRERQFAVRAGVFECGRAAVGFAVEHDVLAQHAHSQRLVAELTVPGSDVPGVAQKHVLISYKASTRPGAGWNHGIQSIVVYTTFKSTGKP